MKKLFLLTKTLLAVALLCVGQNAWADGNKRLLDSQNYESAESPDWVTQNDKVTISLGTGDATYGKYVKVDMGTGAANRGAYKTITPNYEYGSGYTTAGMAAKGYNVEFDILIQSGNTKDRSVSQFVVTTASYTTTTGSLYEGDYIFALSQPTRSASGFDTKWYVNDLTYSDADKAVTLSNSKWYHVKLVVTASSVNYTIIDNSTSESVKSGSKTVASLPSLYEFFTVVGRGYGKTQFDNMEIYDYIDEIAVTAPTFSFKKVDGIKRVYTLSNPNGAGTLYYTTSPAGEAPAKGDAAYSSTASTSLDVEYSETGTYYAYVLHSGGSATSSVTSQEVVAGAVTLNAPVFKVEDMVLAEDGFYYPKVSFSSNNSGLPGSPTATFDVASPYTFTSTGYIDVTASATGYTSSTSRFTVSSKYVNTKTIDFGAIEKSDFDAGTWSFGTGVPRDYWTSRAAAIPADVDMCYLTNTSSTSGDPDNSAVVEGITISNYNQRAPEFCIGYGMYTPYTAISGSGNNMNFTVNGATAEDYAVYNGWNNYGSGTFNTVQAGNATFALYRYDTMLRTIKVYSPAPASVSATIGSNGFTTFASPYALDLTSATQKANGFTAYRASAVNGETVTFKDDVNQTVVANTGVLLQGTANAVVTIPVVASGSALAENALQVNVAGTTFPAVANTTYYGMNKDSNPLTFGTFNPSTVAIPASKAYLALTSNAARSIRVVFGDITGVANVEAAAEAKVQDGKFIENGKLVIVKNGQKFNAAGAQVK